MIFSEIQKRIITTLILLPVTTFLILSNQKLFSFFLILILIFSCYEWFNLNKKKISITLILGFLIILLSIFFSYFLRGNEHDSKIIFLWIIFVCIFSDIGGFIFGKIFGGRKLTKISPNKTFAGLYGSLIFSIFPILILYFLKYELSSSSILILSWKIIILSLLISLVCQLGDITVSFFKRKNEFKDTGNLLPGHGGLLDRIDGIIFVVIFSGILKICEVF